MTVVLIGGGTEEAGGWSDPLFAEIASGHTVAVLGTEESSEPGWYRDYLLSLGAVDAEEIVLATREEAEAVDLSRFDAFFLRGGDQWAEISAWDGTPVEDALLAATVVGGTSAGAMVLGGLDYTAEDGGVDPEDVLAGYDAQLATGFVDDLLPGVLVDTHFGQRGRLGRLLPWVLQEGVEGIGVDDMTGVVVGDDGSWTVYGTATVTRLVPDEDGTATMDVLTASSDEEDAVWGWETVGLHVADGTEGTWTILHPTEEDLYCGTLELTPGRSEFEGIAVADAWNADSVEPRVAGAIYAMPTLSLPVAVLMPAGTTVDILSAGGFSASGDAAAIVIDGGAVSVGPAVGWQDPDCENPRMARGVRGLRAAVAPADGTVVFPGLGFVGDLDTGAGDTGAPAVRAEAPADGACGCRSSGVATALLPVLAFTRRRRRMC